jgi:hypothetical protein
MEGMDILDLDIRELCTELETAAILSWRNKTAVPSG